MFDEFPPAATTASGSLPISPLKAPIPCPDALFVQLGRTLHKLPRLRWIHAFHVLKGRTIRKMRLSVLTPACNVQRGNSPMPWVSVQSARICVRRERIPYKLDCEQLPSAPCAGRERTTTSKG